MLNKEGIVFLVFLLTPAVTQLWGGLLKFVIIAKVVDKSDVLWTWLATPFVKQERGL